MQQNARNLSTETALRLVANPRRRTILRRLVESGDGAVSVTNLAEAVVEAESRTGGSSNHVDRVVVDLHHVHLQKLAEENVVDYDARSGSVRYRPVKSIEKLLRFVGEELE